MDIILIFLIFYQCLGEILAFDSAVIPACDKNDDECEFFFDVNYMFTMMYYKNDHDAVPVVTRNNTLMKRSLDRENTFTPITEEELDQVITGDGSNKLLTVVNRDMPGTPIVVYEGQTIKVNVKNNLFNEGFTIHWHGMIQKNTPWMDGASMVTQCPINVGQTFQYKFKAEPRGTHWYHSHQGTLRSDGLFGPLIVLPRKNRRDIPEVESEFMFILQDWNRNQTSMWTYQVEHWHMSGYQEDFNCTSCYRKTLAVDGSVIGMTPFHSALINGKGHFYPNNGDVPLNPELPLETFTVERNRYYRFRVLNAAMSFPFRLSIDGHFISVIATDGNDVEMETAQSVIISSGERFDILVHTNAKVDNYWIRAESIATRDRDHNPRNPGYTLAVLRYEDAPETLPTTTKHKCTITDVCKVLNCPYLVYGSDANIVCMTTSEFRSTKEALRRNPVPKPDRGEEIREDFFNFHHAGTKKLTAVNARRFVPPSCPPQVIYEPTARICFDDCQDHDCEGYCECTHTHKYDQEKLNTAVQMVLVNMDDYDSGTNHPIHLHGHHFHVVKVGFPDVDHQSGLLKHDSVDIRCSGVNCSRPLWGQSQWNRGNLPGLNLRDPPLKDTVTIPWRGYVVIRFRLDNPGYWLMHCHMEAHQLEGMTIIIKEGLHKDQVVPPEGFPLCGNFQMGKKDNNLFTQQYHKGTASSTSGNYEKNMTQSTFIILVTLLCLSAVLHVIMTAKFISKRSRSSRIPSSSLLQEYDSPKRPLLTATNKSAEIYL